MKQKSFMKRIIVSYLIIAVLPLTIIMSVLANSTINNARETIKGRLQASAELIASQFNFLLDNMSFLSIDIISNDTFINAAKHLKNETIPRMQQEYYSQISSEICTYAIISSLHDVTFFNDKGYLVTSREYNRDFNYTFRLDEEYIHSIPWYEEVQQNFGQAIVLPIGKNNSGNTKEETLALARAIRNPAEIIGYICIEISADNLKHLLKIDESQEIGMMIIRNDGLIMFRSNDFPVVAEDNKVNSNDLLQIENRYFISSQSGNDYTVFLTQSHRKAYEGISSSLRMIVIESVFLSAVMICTIWFFSKDLARPLQALQFEMDRTDINNLEEKQNSRLFDKYKEISYLYHQFNEMRSRLNIMIRNEVETQKMYLEEKMKYLQAQINPHFLCNTLNVIGIMGIERDVPQINDACMQLSSILQYSISDKFEAITILENEMDNIRNYLKLMHLRYEHKLDYTISYDECMKEILLPRLVLEPFIENIFAHAYSSKHRVVSVRVLGWIQNERWNVSISDDGKGLTQDELDNLLKHIMNRLETVFSERKKTDQYGIGIENTIMRLSIFDRSFQYIIQSSPDKGFNITLSADYKRTEDYEQNESINC